MDLLKEGYTYASSFIPKPSTAAEDKLQIRKSIMGLKLGIKTIDAKIEEKTISMNKNIELNPDQATADSLLIQTLTENKTQLMNKLLIYENASFQLENQQRLNSADEALPSFKNAYSEHNKSSGGFEQKLQITKDLAAEKNKAITENKRMLNAQASLLLDRRTKESEEKRKDSLELAKSLNQKSIGNKFEELKREKNYKLPDIPKTTPKTLIHVDIERSVEIDFDVDEDQILESEKKTV